MCYGHAYARSVKGNSVVTLFALYPFLTFLVKSAGVDATRQPTSRCRVYGEYGVLTIHEQAQCPTKVEVKNYMPSKTEEFEEGMPEESDKAKACAKFNYYNSGVSLPTLRGESASSAFHHLYR